MSDPEKLFIVIDKETGKEADLQEISDLIACEDMSVRWCKDLIYCDITGWVIDDFGDLALCDDTGQMRYPPTDRYEVRPTMSAWKAWVERSGGTWATKEDCDER